MKSFINRTTKIYSFSKNTAKTFTLQLFPNLGYISYIQNSKIPKEKFRNILKHSKPHSYRHFNANLYKHLKPILVCSTCHLQNIQNLRHAPLHLLVRITPSKIIKMRRGSKERDQRNQCSGAIYTNGPLIEGCWGNTGISSSIMLEHQG